MKKDSVPQTAEELGAALRPALPGALPLAAQAEARQEPSRDPYAIGYREGREDVLFALARGHRWAVDALEAARRDAVQDTPPTASPEGAERAGRTEVQT